MIRLPAQVSERFRHILVLEAPGLEAADPAAELENAQGLLSSLCSHSFLVQLNQTAHQHISGVYL